MPVTAVMDPPWGSLHWAPCPCSGGQRAAVPGSQFQCHMSHPLKAQVLQPAITSVQDIWSLKKEPHPHQQSPSWSLTTRVPLSVSVDLPVLDVSHQWDHTLCVLCLLLTEHHVLRVHPHGGKCQGFPFPCLSDAPRGGGTCGCV